MADFSKHFARDVGLEHPERYSSHAYKRTAITWMADRGLTLSEIKSSTKHKSSTVVEGYIAASAPQKRKAAEAVGMVSSSSSFSSSSSSRQRVEVPAGQAGQGQSLILHLSGTFNIGGSLNVMAGSCASPPRVGSSVTIEKEDFVVETTQK
jgi:hypothetical protein